MTTQFDPGKSVSVFRRSDGEIRKICRERSFSLPRRRQTSFTGTFWSWMEGGWLVSASKGHKPAQYAFSCRAACGNQWRFEITDSRRLGVQILGSCSRIREGAVLRKVQSFINAAFRGFNHSLHVMRSKQLFSEKQALKIQNRVLLNPECPFLFHTILQVVS